MESDYRQPPKKGLQGTRPASLDICKGSHRIRKPSAIPPTFQYRKPVIIHVRSPEVIHTKPENFMALVQRLTGSSPREENTAKREEAAAEGLRPSTWTDHPESITDPSFGGHFNDVSTFAQGDDPIEMSSDILNVCGAQLEEGLNGDLGEYPANMTSPYAEDRHTSLPGSYPTLHSVDFDPPSPNNTILMMPSEGVQDYSLNMYECSHLSDSMIRSDSYAMQLDRPTISDPLHVFTSFPRDCPSLDQDDFSVPIPAGLDLFNNGHEYRRL